MRDNIVADSSAVKQQLGGPVSLKTALCYTSAMSPEDPTARTKLEERITYCEHLVDTLNGVATDLQKRVLALEAQNRKLALELQRQQEAARALGAADERPPHY